MDLAALSMYIQTTITYIKLYSYNGLYKVSNLRASLMQMYCMILYDKFYRIFHEILASIASIASIVV